MDLTAGPDIIIQAELRKGADLMAGKSSAATLICAIYLHASDRGIEND